MGPQATQVFYQRILDRTDAARDQEHLPTLIWSDTTMPDRTEAILSGNGEPCYDRLREDAALLARCGCTLLAIPCNTSHFFVPRLQEAVSVPVVNMIRESVEVMARNRRRRVGILATDGTIQAELYQKELAAHGLEPVVPARDMQDMVMQIIYDEIKRGETGSREKFTLIDRALRDMGCDGAILACTELSVYRAYHSLPDFYLDAMEVLAEVCITRCGYPLRAV